MVEESISTVPGDELFGDLVLDVLRGAFSVLRVGSETRIYRSWWRDSPLASSADLLEYSLGFDLYDGCGYALGNAHPDPRAHPSPWMKAAFTSFQQLLLRRSARVSLEDCYFEGGLNRHVTTFGSPSSNEFARRTMGYDTGRGGDVQPYVLRQAQGFRVHYPVRYDLAESGERVNRLRFEEPHWTLNTPTGRLVPLLDSRRRLLEDFLILTCGPNLACEQTRRTLEARIRAEQLHAIGGGSNREYAEVERLARGTLHKMLIVGGLHGPGTAAAELVLGDKTMIKTLAAALRVAGLEGKYWQAVFRATVRWNASEKLDTPVAVTFVDVYPVTIPGNL